MPVTMNRSTVSGCQYRQSTGTALHFQPEICKQLLCKSLSIFYSFNQRRGSRPRLVRVKLLWFADINAFPSLLCAPDRWCDNTEATLHAGLVCIGDACFAEDALLRLTQTTIGYPRTASTTTDW
ncbi:hypothetical protein M407DRAFT_122882 [Tulasnella calospora MUT 4182]|uniref:Uncharacterized protein n=1 Tax=Tulasnella calospora MUT 4182 TaxID=1051891 RepID=A0A0C3QAL7_9AGAM|nr:hypothetical protein M407DRAFT_122882 [Tulasnella calospora MUT 4182]